VLINAISVPLQIGVYRDSIAIDKIEIDGKTSDVLLQEIEKLQQCYGIDSFIYANGPGSYMSIKLTYILLRTIEMIRGIPFSGCSAFELNGGKPVRAMGNIYFTKEKETIITQKFDEKVMQEFWLPDDLSALSLEKENIPLYILPAV
jgi:tRNA A37 threonylcarbamoyladenosine modification protein TsaB